MSDGPASSERLALTPPRVELHRAEEMSFDDVFEPTGFTTPISSWPAPTICPQKLVKQEVALATRVSWRVDLPSAVRRKTRGGIPGYRLSPPEADAALHLMAQSKRMMCTHANEQRASPPTQSLERMPVVREERPVEIFEDDLSDSELSEITVRAESLTTSRDPKIMVPHRLLVDSCLDKPVAEHCT